MRQPINRPKYKVGQRAKWLADVDVDCDTGVIVAVEYVFMGTPSEKIWYTLQLDKPAFPSSSLNKTYKVGLTQGSIQPLKRIK